MFAQLGVLYRYLPRDRARKMTHVAISIDKYGSVSCEAGPKISGLYEIPAVIEKNPSFADLDRLMMHYGVFIAICLSEGIHAFLG